jgi:hypothetical protein
MVISFQGVWPVALRGAIGKPPGLVCKINEFTDAPREVTRSDG